MVNPFLNPAFAFKSVKSYLFDVDRMWHIPPHKLKLFQDKALRQAVKYAYTVPLYNKKYKELNLHPNDIKGIDDLHKLPTVSKNDIRKAFPDGVMPRNVNKDRLWKINSSGSTGKPLSFYRDTFGLFKDNIAGIRTLKFCGINWRKDRITCMGPYSSPDRYDHVNAQAITDNLNFFLPSNYQYLTYIYKDLKEKFEKINTFKPAYILGHAGDLRAMASLKKKGYGKNIKPKVIVTSGGMLDEYVRSYIEDAFQCKVVDMYSSVEMGYAAIQCEEGNYHVFSDYLFLEFLDDSGEPVSSGEPGRIAVTRFFGKGTPFIRYTGIDDIVTPLYETCPCGLYTQLIKRIEGRQIHHIHLPDGRFVTPVFFTRGILQYQIVQESSDKIDILIVIDEDQRNDPPSLDLLFTEIKREYYKRFGETLRFEVKEVKKVMGSDNPIKPPPIIFSKLNKSKISK